MKSGYLSEYFDGVAAKILSAVEVDVLTSNQHEFNGTARLREILGEPSGKQRYEAKFLYLTDSEIEPIIDEGSLTWYDVREKARLERGVDRSEYRLYFQANRVLQYANAGDILVIAKRPDNTLLCIIAESESTMSQQILWLFGIPDLSDPGFLVRADLESEQDRVEFASRFILENLGINIVVSGDDYLDEMLKKFSGQFPTTKEFSAYARSTLSDINSNDDQDAALMEWMEREETLFRMLEKHIIGEKFAQKDIGDVDGILALALSAHNRRKSRVGLALENHLEAIFEKCCIRYSRGSVTEHKSKPDFVFPGIKEYHDDSFESLRLTMLGVKSTCKDRWRQVLAEADRIDKKHLLTLEAAISKSQTDEMQSKDLQLVVPKGLHYTYSTKQQGWLANVSEFVDLVRDRQSGEG